MLVHPITSWMFPPKAAEAHVAEIRARVVGWAALQTRSAAEEAAFQACVSKEIILEVAGILYFQLTCIQRISKDCVDVHIEKYCNRRQHWKSQMRPTLRVRLVAIQLDLVVGILDWWNWLCLQLAKCRVKMIEVGWVQHFGPLGKFWGPGHQSKWQTESGCHCARLIVHREIPATSPLRARKVSFPKWSVGYPGWPQE